MLRCRYFRYEIQNLINQEEIVLDYNLNIRIRMDIHLFFVEEFLFFLSNNFLLGSMGSDATTKTTTESNGLSILDIVKHAVKTIIETLGIIVLQDQQDQMLCHIQYSLFSVLCEYSPLLSVFPYLLLLLFLFLILLTRC